MRVTNSMLFRLTLGDLGDIASQNNRLMQQAGTGRKLIKPSDNPADAVRQLRLRQDITSSEELISRFQSGSEQLRTTELALDNAAGVLVRARDLAIQGASSALSDSDQQAILQEVDQLLQDMVAIGNRRVNDRYLFGGTMTTTQPFTVVGDPPTGVAYNGNSGTRLVQPADGVSIDVNVPGDEAFQGSTGDVFQSLVDLRQAVAGRDVNALSGGVLAGLDAAAEQITNTRTRVGAAMSGLERAADNLEATLLNRKSHLADIEDVDIAQTLVDLQLNESRRQAALQAASRVLQPTLFDMMA